MAASATGQAQLNSVAPTSFGFGVGSGVRQALALVGGAVETNQTIRREARFIERREPRPFTNADQVDIRSAANGDDKPPSEDAESETVEFRKLSLTGQPAAEQEPVRGGLVDIET